jgi:hypothetical protein
LDTRFESSLQLIAVAGNDRNGNYAYRSEDQGVLREVLTVFFADESF